MNINIYNPYVRNELYHHGIRGQKWGKRNGPPYPLGAGDHSASEKKAGWRKSLDNDGKTDKVKKPKKQTIGSTDHPKSEKSIAKELQFLGDIAGHWSRSDDNAAEINERTLAFMKKIEEKSIDWYEDEPKSERAKAWKKEKDKAFEKIEKTLEAKAKDADKLYQTTRDNDPMWKFAGIESRKVKDLYEAYRKARKEWWDAKSAVRSLYDDKLVDVVLKDLGIPVTEENRKRIYASEVLFWD